MNGQEGKSTSASVMGIHGYGRREFFQVAGTTIAAVSLMHGLNEVAATAIQGEETMPVQMKLHDLSIQFDQNSGSILSLNHPGPGTFLECDATLAGLLDLAYPIPDFSPLRLASRFSHGVVIEQSGDGICVKWEALGASRDVFDLPGNVSAQVHMKPLADGHSISLSCTIMNHSEQSIPQVVFPDLNGLLPVAGPEHTIFKTGGFGSTPFVELRMNEARRSTQFMNDIAYGAVQYDSGGMFSSMWLRWMDLGGLQGGFSLFPKRWGWDTRAVIRLHHWEQEDKLRLLCVHTTDIQPGETWDSGEYILTPHHGGWAKGIEPYRDWVHKNTRDRPWPLPRHVQEGLGYRTIWMSQGFPNDPKDIIWHMRDLEDLAIESNEHGLNEIVIWGFVHSFKLPLPDPLPHLGTFEDFCHAVQRCRDKGVNIVPFISVLQAGEDTAHKYGLRVPESGGWPQHTDTIPRFQAPYLPLYRCAQVDTGNTLWQQEVLDSCKRLIEGGIPSISWDQYWSTVDGHQNELGAAIRDMAYAVDPNATFSAEQLWNLEVDWRELDYTWNWGTYRDCQAFTSTFQTPRVSCNVDSCPLTAYRGFMDNLYLNVFPRKPESVNGSDWIANHSALSDVLKRCAALRRQFLSYFTDGTLLGNCILSQPCEGAHVTAYVLPDRIMMLVLNLGMERDMELRCELGLWLQPGVHGYQIIAYDEDGHEQTRWNEPTGAWLARIQGLDHLGLRIFEIKTAMD